MGIYQHCGAPHLQRQITEFDFRYFSRSGLGVGDDEHAEIALRGIVDKRPTYRWIGLIAA